MRRVWLGMTAVLSACSGGPEPAAEKERLLAWRTLTIREALKCDAPVQAMKAAMAGGDLVAASAAASRAGSTCEAAMVAISDFGELPGKGTSESTSALTHECGLDLMKMGEAAKATIGLIDGDDRPSVQAGIAEHLRRAAVYARECNEDMDARARSLGVPQAEIDAIASQARLDAAGAAPD